MNRSLMTRALIIAGVALFFAFSAWPPKDKIRLGLDLRGGMHLVAKVRTNDALKAETDKEIDRLEQQLQEKGLTPIVSRTNDVEFSVAGIPADRDAELRDEVFEPYLPGWETARDGDQLRFEMAAANASEIRELAVRQALETIRNRIDAFGVAEPVIHREGIGGDRLVIQLPGVDDPQRIKELIKSTSFLELRLVADGYQPAATREEVAAAFPGGYVPPTVEILPEVSRDPNDPNGRETVERWWPVETKRVITGRDLKTARPSAGQLNEPTVNFLLTREGGRIFGEATAANQGRLLAIIIDGKVKSAPRIEARITDEGVIHGSFTATEVQDLATTLRSGALPAAIDFLEERTVGPSLGRDSIAMGKMSGYIGAALVVLTMLLVYKLAGVNAVAALGLNILLIFGGLAMVGATLTLPGIAGIVLTIGMAVDANVLIFERIKEELRSGRTVKSAIAAGFEKALSSIVDGNLTTLIAALFLMLFGSGPVRGFAVTLSIGIVASMFTAVFVSRWLFDLTYGRQQRVEKLSI